MKMASSCARRARRLASAVANVSAENCKPYNEIPGPTRWPFFGNLLSYRFGAHKVEQYADALAEMRRVYGPLVRESRGWGRGDLLHVFEPDDARTIFAAEGRQPHILPLQETAQLYRSMRGLSAGLGNLNGDEWHRLRSAVQQAMMRPRVVQKYLPLVDAVARDFVLHVVANREDRSREVFGFERLAGLWSLESSAQLVFEKRLGGLTKSKQNLGWHFKMLAANSDMFDLSGDLKFQLPIFRYLSTPKWLILVEAEDFFYGETQALINQTIVKLKTAQSADAERTFIASIINHAGLSEKDISIVCLSLFGDGLNTTAPALIYNLYCLATNPDKQERLFAEIGSQCGGFPDELSAEKLANMPYLKACLKETFRLFPVGTEVTRVPQTDLVLSGYRVPANTAVDINMGPALLSEEHFAEPLAYRPERWLRDAAEYEGGSVHPFLHVPFGHGPRMCAGRRFAEQDLQVLLVRLLQRFRVEYHHGRLRQQMRTLLVPNGSCQFSFFDRAPPT